MMNYALALVAALSLTTIGCKKNNDAKVDPTKSADPAAKSADPAAKTAEAAPAPSGKCPDGFTQKVTFCIKLPPGASGDGGKGMTVGNGKQMQYGWAGGDKGSDYGITIVVGPKNEFYADYVTAVKNPPYKGKELSSGKVGDVGAWSSGEAGPPPDGFAQRHYINSTNRNEKEQLTCNVSRASGTGTPTEDEVFEACKSIQFAL